MSNKTYDILKYIAQIFLPALSVFYLGIAETWSLPLSAEISGTIMLIDTFLGALLMLSSHKYNKNGGE